MIEELQGLSCEVLGLRRAAVPRALGNSFPVTILFDRVRTNQRAISQGYDGNRLFQPRD